MVLSRSTVVSAVRIALYTALAIAMIGSRHYLLFGPQKEYVAVALPAVLTVIYVALGLFIAAGSSVRSELLTIARFPICWSVVLLAISGNVKDSGSQLPVHCSAGWSLPGSVHALRTFQANLRGVRSSELLSPWRCTERSPHYGRHDQLRFQ